MKKLIIAFSAVLFTLLITACNQASSEKSGSIIEIVDDNVVFQAYENEGMDTSRCTFNFEIDNQTLLPLAYKAMIENKEVKINYHTEFSFFETANKIDSIKIID